MKKIAIFLTCLTLFNFVTSADEAKNDFYRLTQKRADGNKANLDFLILLKKDKAYLYCNDSGEPDIVVLNDLDTLKLQIDEMFKKSVALDEMVTCFYPQGYGIREVTFRHNGEFRRIRNYVFPNADGPNLGAELVSGLHGLKLAHFGECKEGHNQSGDGQ